MYEEERAMKASQLGLIHDPMENVTCGDNLRRKIAEQEDRLEKLKESLEEMEKTGLANIKIRALQDMMMY